ncbi:MAG: protein-export rane protein SecD, preprotein translocase subunit SecD [Patescibacteria group bacterium]|jgi:preprotein translocase subunit SecD|nr:protein-export rane protein SecD, preprotein translocase subunit SecD [Patescibacteria group bacterium]
MRRRLWITFSLIALLAAAAAYISWPSTELLRIGTMRRDVSLRQGLDLKGGAHLIYEADTSKLEPGDISEAMDGVRGVIEGRINGLGVSEPEIRISTIGDKPAIIVDLPGISDIAKAKEIIGSTAKLEFKDETGQTILEGKDLRPQGAQATPLQTASGTINNNSWQVELSLTSEGKDKFAAATTANVGKQIGIFLDEQLISNPSVNQPITDGNPVITGDFTAQDAREFALRLNYGALPVPISIVQEQSVGASLGNDAVSQTILAGAIGITLIFLFIIAYYKWCGVIATLSLIVYALLNIALYKLLPVTMTLAGIAAFIISMGIAVDTNILTFERLKEELRLGKPLPVAIQESFRRSWTSIRDSHVAGLISAFIIFTFASGPVRGFALVLIIGTILSLFTAITVTRTWMLLVAGSRFRQVLAIANKA